MYLIKYDISYQSHCSVEPAITIYNFSFPDQHASHINNTSTYTCSQIGLFLHVHINRQIVIHNKAVLCKAKNIGKVGVTGVSYSKCGNCGINHSCVFTYSHLVMHALYQRDRHWMMQCFCLLTFKVYV